MIRIQKQKEFEQKILLDELNKRQLNIINKKCKCSFLINFSQYLMIGNNVICLIN